MTDHGLKHAKMRLRQLRIDVDRELAFYNVYKTWPSILRLSHDLLRKSLSNDTLSVHSPTYMVERSYKGLLMAAFFVGANAKVKAVKPEEVEQYQRLVPQLQEVLAKAEAMRTDLLSRYEREFQAMQQTAARAASHGKLQPSRVFPIAPPLPLGPGDPLAAVKGNTDSIAKTPPASVPTATAENDLSLQQRLLALQPERSSSSKFSNIEEPLRASSPPTQTTHVGHGGNHAGDLLSTRIPPTSSETPAPAPTSFPASAVPKRTLDELYASMGDLRLKSNPLEQYHDAIRQPTQRQIMQEQALQRLREGEEASPAIDGHLTHQHQIPSSVDSPYQASTATNNTAAYPVYPATAATMHMAPDHSPQCYWPRSSTHMPSYASYGPSSYGPSSYGPSSSTPALGYYNMSAPTNFPLPSSAMTPASLSPRDARPGLVQTGTQASVLGCPHGNSTGPVVPRVVEDDPKLARIAYDPILFDQFLTHARGNSERDQETCGILAGRLQADGSFLLSHVLIPAQSGDANGCQPTEAGDEALFGYQDEHELLTLGWIHTHPSQTAFLSSVDLHTTLSYQLMLPEALAVVCSIKYNDIRLFRLTAQGVTEVLECQQRGHHPHSAQGLFVDSGHTIQRQMPDLVQVIDLRTSSS